MIGNLYAAKLNAARATSSGTEPIFRVYAESKDKHQAELLASTYKKIVEDMIQNINTA